MLLPQLSESLLMLLSMTASGPEYVKRFAKIEVCAYTLNLKLSARQQMWISSRSAIFSLVLSNCRVQKHYYTASAKSRRSV